MQTAGTLPNYETQRNNRRASIAQWRENLIDLNIVVFDCRQELDAAVDQLRAAVRERDRAADMLDSLMTMQTHYDGAEVTG